MAKYNGKYRIVCTPEGVWHIETMILKNDKLFWTIVYRCDAKHEAGYNEAREWITNNAEVKS